MGRPIHVEVTLEEVRGNTSKLIKKFIKKVKKSKILERVREKAFYEKPSKKRRRQKLKKLQNVKKSEAERRKKLEIKYN
jgi:ribosomal protein S21